MEETKLISVIVPVYNAAAFLPRCIESLLGQTYTSLEIICVDDGSTDNSLTILREYAAKDVRIKVIHQENAGVSAARNRGLDAAIGDFVTFVDSDDWLEANAYEKVLSSFDAVVDVVCFGTVIEGESASSYTKEIEKYLRIPVAGTVSKESWAVSSINGCIWNKVYRRNIIQQAQLRFVEDLTFSEDECFCYCFFGVARAMKMLQAPLYHYVQHSASVMQNARLQGVRVLNSIKSLRILLSFFLANGVYEDMKKLFLHRYTHCFYWVSNLEEQQKRISLFRELYQMLKLSGLRTSKKHEAVRGVLSFHQSFLSRCFCSYVDNRVCYGIGKIRLISITYTGSMEVYRFLGRVVWTRNYEEKELMSSNHKR